MPEMPSSTMFVPICRVAVPICRAIVALGCLVAGPASAQDFVADAFPPPAAAGGDTQLLPPTEPGGPVFLDDPYLPGPYRDGGATGVPGDAFDDLWAARPWSWQVLPFFLVR